MASRLLDGSEPFTFQGNMLPLTVKDFWSWSSSDLINNTLRGSLAEYIVALALNIDTNSTPREDWSAYDLLYKNVRLEVKASGYLQAWNVGKVSNIIFNIRPTRTWDPVTGYTDEVTRHL